MLRPQGFAVLIGCLVLPLVTAADNEPADQAELLPVPPRPEYRDRQGDLLPPGALARIGTVRFRHGGSVFFVGYAALGKQIVSAGNDNFVRIWDAATGKEIRRIALPSAVNSGGSSSYSDGNSTVVSRGGMMRTGGIALSADGRSLATIGQDGTLVVWDMASGAKMRQFQVGNGSALAFAADGNRLVSRGFDGTLRLWDVGAGKEIKQIGKPPAGSKRRYIFFGDQGTTLAFSPDGKTLASFSAELDNNQLTSALVFWDIESGKEISRIKGQNNQFNGVAILFVADGKQLAWASADGITRIYEVESGKELRTLGQQQFGFGVILALSPDGKTLGVRSRNAAFVQLFDLSSGKELRRIGEPAGQQVGFRFFDQTRGPCQDFAFAPDGQTLALGTSRGGVFQWNIATGKQVAPVEGSQGAIAGLMIAPDGQALTVAADRAIGQCDAATGKELRRMALPDGVEYAAFSADGRLAALGMPGNRVRLWDMSAGKEIHNITIGQATFQLDGGGAGMTFTHDGTTLLVKDYDSTVRLFDTTTGKEVGQFSTRANAGPQLPTTVFVNGVAPGIAFAPHGKLLASVDVVPRAGADPQQARFNDNNLTIRCWRVATGKLMCQFESTKVDIAGIAFSPDGRMVASANSDYTVSLWETATGKERCRLSAKGNPGTGDLLGKAFQLISGNNNLVSPFCSIAFAPDGRTLAGGGDDRVVHLWDVRTGKKLGALPGHEGSIRNLMFTADCKRIVSGSVDTTALVWDLSHLPAPAFGPQELDPTQMAALWNDLAGSDGRKAFTAITSLITAPAPAVAWLKQNAQPEPGIDEKRLAQLVADLDGDQFMIRQKAEMELERLGELAEPALLKVLQSKPTLEVYQRVERLINKLGGPVTEPETLRTLRAIEILEGIGTPEARQVLDKLAGGAIGSPRTREAQAARERLAGRAKP